MHDKMRLLQSHEGSGDYREITLKLWPKNKILMKNSIFLFAKFAFLAKINLICLAITLELETLDCQLKPLKTPIRAYFPLKK